MIKTFSFRGRQFLAIEGVTHPAYSFFTFDGEEKDFREQYWFVKPGDVVFDIGASYGAYTLSSCVAGALVYSFEPETTVYNDLLNNIELNNFYSRARLFNCGLWNKQEEVDMKEYAPHWPTNTISSKYFMDTVDNIVNQAQLTKIDWMKIDVEGAELEVIEGAAQSISKFKPKMIIECHSFLDPKMVEKVKTLVSALGEYEFQEIPRPPCTMVIAKIKGQ